MSLQALTWALKQPVRPSAKKFTLVTLANYASEEGVCYPSQKTIAEITAQCERSVRDHLAALEKDGFIIRVSRRRSDGTWANDAFQLLWNEGTGEGRGEQIGPAARSADGRRRGRKSADSDQGQNFPEVDSADGNGFVGQRQHSPPPAEIFSAHIEEPKQEPSQEPSPSLRSGRARGAAPKHGTRLPDDWKPGQEERDFARSLDLSEDEIDYVAAEYADYWHGIPGQKGVKLDWLGTWRNWVRRFVRNDLPKLRNAHTRSGNARHGQDAATRSKEFDRKGFLEGWMAGDSAFGLEPLRSSEASGGLCLDLTPESGDPRGPDEG